VVQDLGFPVSSAKSASGKPLYVSARNGEEIGRENHEVAVVPDMESAAFAGSVGERDAAARVEGSWLWGPTCRHEK
jgi:tRNA U55 pseudouridine synthase TruB